MSNAITSPGIPANVRTLETPTTWTRTTVELVRGLTCTQKTVQQRWSSIAFDFFDLSSSNLLHESSVELWDNLSRAQNALSWPRSSKFEACPTMPYISLVLIFVCAAAWWKYKLERTETWLGRASSEPHSYVLTWLSVTVYIGIYISTGRPLSLIRRPASR